MYVKIKYIYHNVISRVKEWKRGAVTQILPRSTDAYIDSVTSIVDGP